MRRHNRVVGVVVHREKVVHHVNIIVSASVREIAVRTDLLAQLAFADIPPHRAVSGRPEQTMDHLLGPPLDRLSEHTSAGPSDPCPTDFIRHCVLVRFFQGTGGAFHRLPDLFDLVRLVVGEILRQRHVRKALKNDVGNFFFFFAERNVGKSVYHRLPILHRLSLVYGLPVFHRKIGGVVLPRSPFCQCPLDSGICHIKPQSCSCLNSSLASDNKTSKVFPIHAHTLSRHFKGCGKNVVCADRVHFNLRALIFFHLFPPHCVMQLPFS